MKKKLAPVMIIWIFFFILSPQNTAIAKRRKGSLTLSPVGGAYLIEGNQDFDGGQVYGLGIGFNFTRHWAVELMGKYRNFEKADGSAPVPPFEEDMHGYIMQLDLLYHIMPDKRFVPYFALGGGGLKIDNNELEDDEITGFANYGTGFNYFLTQNIAFRADARHVITFDDDKHHNNLSLLLGLTFLIGCKRQKEPPPPPIVPKDTDADGIIDLIDKCPDTPIGVVVDEDGCPLDSDKDGVPDYGDKCPDTPENAQVDEIGCPTDTDNDGVYDHLDKCPDTPSGLPVDSRGCPLDSDKDAVPDYMDKCPNSPLGVQVDNEGCPLDSDKDGVLDYGDKCPNTPFGVQVDNEGCPLDSDKDAVPDYGDKCPNTPLGAVVDENGCWSIGTVLFDTDKWDIRPEAFPELNKVINVLNKTPDLKIEIQGHTDNTGSKAHNDKLSYKRANSVMDYFIVYGISPERLKAKGYGFSSPVDTNTTSEGRQRNRRVQFEPIYD